MNSHTHSNRSTLVISFGLLIGFMLTLVLMNPLDASAENFAYVDANGEVKTVTAVDGKTAIAIAPNIHMHSGVVLLTSTSNYDIIGETIPTSPATTIGSGRLYAYVDANGEVKTVAAVDWKTAVATAQNIHMHSGVVLLTPTSNYDIVGETIPSAE